MPPPLSRLEEPHGMNAFKELRDARAALEALK